MGVINEKNVIKNASWVIIGKLLQSLLQILVLMTVARYLGPVDFGLVSYAASLVVFATPIAFLGFNNTLVHELVNNKASEGIILGSALMFSLLSSLVCVALIALFVFSFNREEYDLFVVCSIYSLVLVFQTVDLMKYWFQAKLISKYTSLISLVAYILIVIYTLLIIYFEKSVYWFAATNVILFFLASIAFWIFYSKLGGSRLGISVNVGKRILTKSKHFILPSIMVALFSQTDRVMIQSFLGAEAVGLYSAAVSAATMASFVFVSIIDSFRPMVFSFFDKSQIKFRYLMRKLYSIVIYASLLQSILVFFLAELIVFVLFGNEFSAAVDTLRIICWYVMFSFLGSVRNIWILSNGFERYLIWINVVGALLNVSLNFYLIPLYGIEGAAVASVATQLLTNFAVTYMFVDVRGCNRLVFEGLNPRYLKSSVINVISLIGGKK